MDAPQVNKYYSDGRDFFSYMKFPSLWPRCQRFLEGDQWPPPTAKTKGFPRPVINIVRFIESHKVSAIINDPVKMIYSADDEDEQDQTAEVAAELFSEYSTTEWDNVKQDELNEEALGTAANVGTGIWHYYWDSRVTKGRKMVAQGKLMGETLDSMNVFVGDPQCQDTQLQPYILITSREEIANIRNEAVRNGISDVVASQIQSDKDTKDQGYDTAQKEITDKSTVITCYWKELKPPMAYPSVQLMKVCGNVVVKPQTDTQHRLYPIVKMSWYKRNKCWYGQGDTENLITNQKSINYMVAQQMLNAEKTGNPKPVVKPGVSNWNNNPGEAIIDNSGSPTMGIQYLQPASISQNVPNLVDFLLENTKSLAGASESGTGDVSTMSNLSPTVVMALQQASQVPIESIKKRYKRAMKEIGEIWQEFWTINYNTTRVIMINKIDPATVDPNTGKGFVNPDTGIETPPSESKQPQQFKGTDFQGIGLKLKIDIGTSQTFSDQMTITSLDRLLDKGIVDGKTYVEFTPDTAMPFKNDLLKKLEQQPQVPLGMPTQPNIPVQGAMK